MNSCPACSGGLTEGLRPWHRICGECSYEGSVLAPHILEQATGGDLDEQARETALAVLRKRNFAKLHAWLREDGATGAAGVRRPRLLDVGCAHGWFLEQCAADFDVSGLEPDRAVAAATATRGLPVREGFFPDALDPAEHFEVIVFNDVLEHIPDIHATLAACKKHLLPDGLLVVNAPCREGVFYRTSRLLAWFGRAAAFGRMWQEGFPAPHVHYLDSGSMSTLAAAHGFRLVSTRRLPSVSAAGLYARIRYSRDVPAAKAILLTVLITALIPALAMLPPDIRVWTFRRGNRS